MIKQYKPVQNIHDYSLIRNVLHDEQLNCLDYLLIKKSLFILQQMLLLCSFACCTLDCCILFLDHLKVQMSFSDHFLTGVRLYMSVRLSVCKPLNMFDLFSKTTKPISIKLSTKYQYHQVKGSQVCNNEGPHSLSRGDS